MIERYLTKIVLNVVIPVDEHTCMKVVDEVSKITGIAVLGIGFEYFPPIGEPPLGTDVNKEL